jgi:hypothetical protein
VCPALQRAIDALSGSDGCFVKLSSRSPKDAAARTGAFEALYEAAALARTPSGVVADPETKLRIVCEVEGAALRFKCAEDVVRAFVLSERVWQVRNFQQPANKKHVAEMGLLKGHDPCTAASGDVEAEHCRPQVDID